MQLQKTAVGKLDSQDASNNPAQTLAFSNDISSGSAIVVCLTCWNYQEETTGFQPGTISGISDSAGNSYLLIEEIEDGANSHNFSYIFVAYGIPAVEVATDGALTLTVAFKAPNYNRLTWVAYEESNISGIDTFNFGNTNSSSAGGGQGESVTVSVPATSAPDRVIYGTLGTIGAQPDNSITPPTGTTVQDTYTRQQLSENEIHTVRRELPTATAEDYTWSFIPQFYGAQAVVVALIKNQTTFEVCVEPDSDAVANFSGIAQVNTVGGNGRLFGDYIYHAPDVGNNVGEPVFAASPLGNGKADLRIPAPTNLNLTIGDQVQVIARGSNPADGNALWGSHVLPGIVCASTLTPAPAPPPAGSTVIYSETFDSGLGAPSYQSWQAELSNVGGQLNVKNDTPDYGNGSTAVVGLTVGNQYKFEFDAASVSGGGVPSVHLGIPGSEWSKYGQDVYSGTLFTAVNTTLVIYLANATQIQGSVVSFDNLVLTDEGLPETGSDGVFTSTYLEPFSGFDTGQFRSPNPGDDEFALTIIGGKLARVSDSSIVDWNGGNSYAGPMPYDVSRYFGSGNNLEVECEFNARESTLDKIKEDFPFLNVFRFNISPLSVKRTTPGGNTYIYPTEVQALRTLMQRCLDRGWWCIVGPYGMGSYGDLESRARKNQQAANGNPAGNPSLLNDDPAQPPEDGAQDEYNNAAILVEMQEFFDELVPIVMEYPNAIMTSINEWRVISDATWESAERTLRNYCRGIGYDRIWVSHGPYWSRNIPFTRAQTLVGEDALHAFELHSYIDYGTPGAINPGTENKGTGVQQSIDNGLCVYVGEYGDRIAPNPAITAQQVLDWQTAFVANHADTAGILTWQVAIHDQHTTYNDWTAGWWVVATGVVPLQLNASGIHRRNLQQARAVTPAGGYRTYADGLYWGPDAVDFGREPFGRAIPVPAHRDYYGHSDNLGASVINFSPFTSTGTSLKLNARRAGVNEVDNLNKSPNVFNGVSNQSVFNVFNVNYDVSVPQYSDYLYVSVNAVQVTSGWNLSLNGDGTGVVTFDTPRSGNVLIQEREQIWLSSAFTSRREKSQLYGRFRFVGGFNQISQGMRFGASLLSKYQSGPPEFVIEISGGRSDQVLFRIHRPSGVRDVYSNSQSQHDSGWIFPSGAFDITNQNDYLIDWSHDLVKFYVNDEFLYSYPNTVYEPMYMAFGFGASPGIGPPLDWWIEPVLLSSPSPVEFEITEFEFLEDTGYNVGPEVINDPTILNSTTPGGTNNVGDVLTAVSGVYTGASTVIGQWYFKYGHPITGTQGQFSYTIQSQDQFGSIHYSETATSGDSKKRVARSQVFIVS